MKTCIAAFSPYQTKNIVKLLEKIRHNSKGIISREAFLDSDGKYSQENVFHWNDQFQRQFFLTNEITIFRNLKTENL